MNNIKKVFIVPYMHADWAWMFTRRWHEKRYALIFGEVLAACKKHPDFRWFLDTYITELEPVLRMRPDLLRELRKHVHAGQIGVCGGYTNLSQNAAGEETQIRDLILGRRMFRKLFPKASLSVFANTVDVSIGHPQVPQLLALGAYRYMRFWRPHRALSDKKIPLEFYWCGLDGSTVLASRGCYSGLNYSQDMKKNFQDEISPEAELSPTGIRWLSMGTDDSRPLRTHYTDEPIPLFEFIRKWNSSGSFPISIAAPFEYFQELESYRSIIPTVSGSLDPCGLLINWGGNYGFQTARERNDRLLTEAERWAAFASLSGFAYPQDDFDGLWREHLTSSAHAMRALFENDFREMSERTEFISLSAKRIRDTALRHLARRTQTALDVEYLVANSLPRVRSEQIQLTVSFPKAAKGVSLFQNGKKIPCQISDQNTKSGKTWEFNVRAKVALLPCGFAALTAKPVNGTATIDVIQFSAKMDNHRLMCVATKHGKYEGSAGTGFGEIRFYAVNPAKGNNLYLGPVTKILPAVWRNTKMLEDGVLCRVFRSEGSVGVHEIRRDLIIRKDKQMIDVIMDIRFGKADGHLTLEWPCPSDARVFGDTPFAVEEKNLSIESFGRKTDGPSWCDNIERQQPGCFYAKSFVCWSRPPEKSLSYISHDSTRSYLLLTGGTERRLANILLEGVAHRPDWRRFVNETSTGEGRHRFTSRFVFHRGGWADAKIHQMAAAMRYPPLIIPAGAAQASKRQQPLSLELSPDNLIMTSFYREGKFFIMRFYEAAGNAATASITLPFASSGIEKTDFNGATIGNCESGRKIHVSVRPHEIVTLRINKTKESIAKSKVKSRHS